MRKLSGAKEFKCLLSNNKLDMILEAHNGLSAKVVEEAGFKAIWASSLTISSAIGARDCSEVSWAEIYDITCEIYDATNIPILLDGDSGYGNFNNVRLAVKKLSHYGIAGICIEDKAFPKLNSFASGSQVLSPIDEFVGKIKAAQDSKEDGDFSVIARTESLIAGLDVGHAIERASKYYEAGCDAIFIHSKSIDGADILEFATNWDKRCPLVVAPTSYTSVPPADLERVGVSIYICANQLLRASLSSMRRMASEIFERGGLYRVGMDISTIPELLSFLDYEELRIAEGKYSK